MIIIFLQKYFGALNLKGMIQKIQFSNMSRAGVSKQSATLALIVKL